MRHKILFPLILTAIIFGGCQESAQVSSRFTVSLHANYIHAERTDIRFDTSQSGTTQFTVQSQDTPWRIENIPDWITVNPTSGSGTTSVTVSVGEHKWASPRVGTFSLTSGSEDWQYTQQLSVSQAGATPYAQMDQTEFLFDGTAHSVSVKAKSNFEWTLSGNNVGWISAVYDDTKGVLNLSVPANDSGDERSATVNVVFNNTVITSFLVVQQPANVSVAADPLDFVLKGGSYKLSITSEAPWKTSNPSWLTISPSSAAAGTTEVTVSAAPNPYDSERSGYLYFQFSPSSVEIAAIEVHQDGILLELDTQEMQNIPAVGGVYKYTLRSNVDWQITEVPDYLKISPTSGSETTELSFEVVDNPTFSEHSGYLTVSRANSGTVRSYWTRQRSRRPNFEQGTWLTCNDLAQTLTLKVDTFGPWYITYERKFFDMTPTVSEGKQDVLIIVDENRYIEGNSNSGVYRQSYAYFRPRGVVDDNYDENSSTDWPIYVNQDAWREKYRVIPGTVTLPVAAGEMDIDLTTTDTWSAELLDSPSWIRLNGKTTGHGSGQLPIAFDANTMAQARSVKVRVSFEHVSNMEFTIVQPGRSIRVNAETLFFFAKGGTSTVSVKADGAYTVERTSGNWFTVTRGENNVFTVVAEAMTEGVERAGEITLKLTDLLSGSYLLKIPVVQMTAAGFSRGGFSEDRDLNLRTAPGFTVKVTGYSEDVNWNGTYHATIGGEGYGDDENWNN